MSGAKKPFGKWSEPNVPHKGWECIGIRDILDEQDDLEICEMCEHQEIRYIHTMQHSAYPVTLDVGCHCAGRMEEDYERAEKREQALKNKISRLERFIEGDWGYTNKGNLKKKKDGYLVVLQEVEGGWKGVLIHLAHEKSTFAKHVHPTLKDAKKAAFESIEILKDKAK